MNLKQHLYEIHLIEIKNISRNALNEFTTMIERKHVLNVSNKSFFNQNELHMLGGRIELRNHTIPIGFTFYVQTSIKYTATLRYYLIF